MVVSIQPPQPQFFIIGAQKAGTTWLWNMLKQHPATSLPETKEIHYFGASELYAKGPQWYGQYFAGLDSSKLIGEASTTYFYDNVPYFHNNSDAIEIDRSLPCIPELIQKTMGNDIKILIVLRDPVARALSAYRHYMRYGNDSPFWGLKRFATEKPKTRIVQYGFYAQYLALWQTYFSPDKLKVLVFEEDIIKTPAKTLEDVYTFLGLDPSFKPDSTKRKYNKSWAWSRIVFHYLTKPATSKLAHSRIGSFFDRFDYLKRFEYGAADVEFLRSIYLPQKAQTEKLLGRNLDCWKYGGP